MFSVFLASFLDAECINRINRIHRFIDVPSPQCHTPSLVLRWQAPPLPPLDVIHDIHNIHTWPVLVLQCEAHVLPFRFLNFKLVEFRSKKTRPSFALPPSFSRWHLKSQK